MINHIVQSSIAASLFLVLDGLCRPFVDELADLGNVWAEVNLIGDHAAQHVTEVLIFQETIAVI